MMDAYRYLTNDAQSGARGQQLDASVEWSCFAATVDADEYDRVVLTMNDGTQEEFTGNYTGETMFAYEGYLGGDRTTQNNPADETFSEFNGKITELTVANGETTQTFENDKNGCPDDVDVACSEVELVGENIHMEKERIEFADGSFKEYDDGDFGSTVTLGSPGRVIETVYLQETYNESNANQDWYRFSNPNTDCDPGSPATTFDCTEVTIRPGEEFNGDTFGQATITLKFADGTDLQTHRGNTVELPTTIRPEIFPSSSSDPDELQEGQVIESVQIRKMAWAAHYQLMNPDVESCLQDSGEEEAKQLEVISTTQDATCTYRFVIDGEVSEASAGGNSAEINSGGPWEDALTENNDGTVTIEGRTGNEEGDVFSVEGSLEEFEKTGGESNLRLILDGEDVTDQYLDQDSGSQLFEVISTTADATVEYEFTVDGSISEASAGGNSAEINSGGEWEDTLTENDDGTVTINGRTGNQEGDVFRIEGELLEFQKTSGNSDLRLILDGEEVTDQYLGNSGSAPSEEVEITFENCHTVSINAGPNWEVEEIHTTFFIEDGVDSLIIGPENRSEFPVTVNAHDHIDIDTVTDATVDRVEMSRFSEDPNRETEDITRENPNLDECSEKIQQQWEEYQNEN